MNGHSIAPVFTILRHVEAPVKIYNFRWIPASIYSLNGHLWLANGQKSSSYSSYEDDIDTNRILIQTSTILKRQTIKISCLRLVYKQNYFHKN